MKHHPLMLLLAIALALGCGKKESTTPAVGTNAPAAPPAKVESARAPAPPAPPKLEGPTAQEILAKAAEAYAALTNYSARGKVVSEIDMSTMDLSKMPGMPQGMADSPEMKQAMSGKQTSTHEFAIKLSRPNRFVIEWELKAANLPAMGKGAVWCDGTSHYLMINPSQYSRIQGRDMALASATGISGGAAHTVPTLFYTNETAAIPSSLKSLQSAARWQDEAVDAEECYVVEGWMGGMAQMRFWITKKDHFIKQRRQILGGDMKPPAVTDDELRESLKAMGQETTPEQLAMMRKMMESATAMAAKMKGTITETHSGIQVNQPLQSADLAFKRPSTAKLVPSPMNQFMKGASPRPASPTPK